MIIFAGQRKNVTGTQLGSHLIGIVNIIVFLFFVCSDSLKKILYRR